MDTPARNAVLHAALNHVERRRVKQVPGGTVTVLVQYGLARFQRDELILTERGERLLDTWDATHGAQEDRER